MAISETIIFGILSAIGFGTADFLSKKAVDKIGPISTIIISMIIGTIPLLLFYTATFEKPPTITFNGVLFSFLSAIFVAVAWIIFYRGLEKGKVSIVSPIASSWGVVAFILALVFLGERLTLEKSFSVVLVLAGVFLTTFVLKEFFSTLGGKASLGAKEAILAMMLYGASAIFMKLYVGEFGALFSMLVLRAIIIVSVFSYSVKNKIEIKTDASLLPTLIGIGLFDALGGLSYFIGISSNMVSIVSTLSSIAPLIALMLAHIFLRERLAGNQYLGIALIIFGVAGLAVF